MNDGGAVTAPKRLLLAYTGSIQRGLSSSVPCAKCRMASSVTCVTHGLRSSTILPVSARVASTQASIWASMSDRASLAISTAVMSSSYSLPGSSFTCSWSCCAQKLLELTSMKAELDHNLARMLPKLGWIEYRRGADHLTFDRQCRNRRTGVVRCSHRREMPA